MQSGQTSVHHQDTILQAWESDLGSRQLCPWHAGTLGNRPRLHPDSGGAWLFCPLLQSEDNPQ